MQHDQTNTTATSIALADAVQAWNENPACRAKMELVYEGSTRVRTADDVLVVRGEFFALGVTDRGPLDALWIELQTCPQRPRYVTRDHRPENGLAGTRSQDEGHGSRSVVSAGRFVTRSKAHLTDHGP